MPATASTSDTLYGWFFLLLGIAFESVALIYQYVLDYGPCPLCIHVRIGVLAFTLVALIALVLSSRGMWRIAYLVNLGLLAWLGERAYLLLGTEKGFVYIECGVDAGMPAWLPLDRWLPLLFNPTESCGYTPKLPFGISMAEALIVVVPLLGLVTLVMLVLSFKSRRV